MTLVIFPHPPASSPPPSTSPPHPRYGASGVIWATSAWASGCIRASILVWTHHSVCLPLGVTFVLTSLEWKSTNQRSWQAFQKTCAIFSFTPQVQRFQVFLTNGRWVDLYFTHFREGGGEVSGSHEGRGRCYSPLYYWLRQGWISHVFTDADTITQWAEMEKSKFWTSSVLKCF